MDEPKISLLGHEGHLDSKQEEDLEGFRRLVTEAGLYTPKDSVLGKLASHTDATLLRFLRARSFDRKGALKQFSDREAWAKRLNLLHLYATSSVEVFSEMQSLFPRWTGRRDKMGYPLCVYQPAKVSSALLSKISYLSLEEREGRISAVQESLLLAINPLMSTLPSGSYPTPVDGTSNIIDMDGLSFYQAWNLRALLQETSTLSNANYPETMGMTWIINAPSFFSTVWSYIQGWLDEKTCLKIHVLSQAQQAELLVEIDAENLPKLYGGQLDWEYHDAPNLDEPTKEAFKAIGGNCPGGPFEYAEGILVFGKDILAVRNGEVSAADALKRRLDTGDIPRFSTYPS